VIFIGDVHGKCDKYNQLISSIGNEKSIQIGDMGFDYSKIKPSLFHKFFKGNHDLYNTDNLPSHENDLGEFGTVDDVYFIRGAYSIDAYCRTIGIDLFENEELSTQSFEIAKKEVLDIKPRIIASHDCPYSFRENHFNYLDRNKTACGLEYIFESYKPEVWVFGHHHINLDISYNKTRFICLSELATVEL
jgi:uncharacterized protein YrrD